MIDRKTHKEIKLNKNEIFVNDLEKYVNIKKYTIIKCLEYLGIKPIRFVYRSQYPTAIYNRNCLRTLIQFLKENPDTRKFFCKLNNRSKEKEVINKIVKSRKSRSEKDKEQSAKKFRKTYKKNKCSEINNKNRQQRILDNCPNGYTPLKQFYDVVTLKSKNKTSYLRGICKALDLDLVNINNNVYINDKDTSKLIKYLKTHYGKAGRYLGESLVAWYLKKEKIKYKYQKFFEGCRSNKTNRILPFDFYLYKYNCCIEIDGAYHITDEKRITNDKIKTRYCKVNKIKLIRIKWGYGKYYTKGYLINTLERKLNEIKSKNSIY